MIGKTAKRAVGYRTCASSVRGHQDGRPKAGATPVSSGADDGGEKNENAGAGDEDDDDEGDALADAGRGACWPW